MVTALLSVRAPAAWADFDDGVAAFERGDYAVALREFETLGRQGHARAQFNVGLIYDLGHGVPSD